MPTRQEIINYITNAAIARGIDPQTALRVVQQESSFNPGARNDRSAREKSYGLFQLNTQGGLGVEARRRGIEPTDPNQWKQHTDFALDTVAKDGWRQWGGARDLGISRWAGIGRNFNPDNIRPPADIQGALVKPTKTKSVDIGDEPSLNTLAPQPIKLPTSLADSAQANVMRQLSPTEDTQMARPSVQDAIRQSMDENNIRDNVRVAGFVPPGLTKASSGVRARANERVVPGGTMKDVEGGARRAEELRSVPNADRQMAGTYADYVRQQQALAANKDIGATPLPTGPYDRNAPSTRGMEGTYADYVAREKARMAAGGEPKVTMANDPKGAADFRDGTPAERLPDPSVTAQNDPAVADAIAARIRGTAVPGSGGAQPRTSNTTPAGRTATAAAATTLGVMGAGGDKGPPQTPPPGAAAAPGDQPQQYNVDPGVAAMEKQLNIPPGTLSNPNSMAPALAPILQKGFPAFQKAMQDPQTRQAAQKVTQSVVQSAAQQDAVRSQVQKDPTYYQQRAALAAGTPGNQGDAQNDRAMDIAIARDNQRAMMQRATMARGVPPSVAQQVQQQTQQPQTTKGTVSVRRTPPEQGDQQPTPVPPGYPQDQPVNKVQSQRMPGTQGFPQGYTYGPAAYDAQNAGVPNLPPQMQQQPLPMTPEMQQLFQFFTQGGGQTGE